MKDHLARLGGFLFRRRGLVLLIWLGLLLGCALEFALDPKPPVMTESTGASQTEAYKVMEILRDDFGFRLGNNLALVFEGPETQAAAVQQLKQTLRRSFPQIVQIYEFSGKNNPRLRILFFQFQPDFSFVAAQDLVQHMRHLLDGWEQRIGTRTWLTGNLAFYTDIAHESESYISASELFALGFAFVILVFSFGGLFAALLPILMGAATLVFLHGLLRLTGLDSTPMSDILNSLLGLALAIDYSLFIVSRFQEELAAGAAAEDALRTTLRHAGKTILVSAVIVLASIVVLLIPEVTGSRIMARNLMLVIGFSVFNSVLVLPALLVLSRRILAWPAPLTRLIQGFDRYGAWQRFARHVTDRPRLYFLLSLGVLAALAAPVTGMRLWDPVQTLASKQSESMQGYEVLRADGWGGQMVPIQLIVRSRDGQPIDSPAGLAYIYDLTLTLQHHPAVAGVQSLTSWSPGFSQQDYLDYYASLRNLKWISGLLPIAGALPSINPGGDKHLIAVFPKDIMAVESTYRLADDIRAYAGAHPGFETLTGGVVERARDFTTELYRRTPLMVGIVILSIFALLFIYMRALVLPLKAGFMNFVPILGAFGVLTLVFQHGWLSPFAPHNGAVTSIIPITLFCIVFGLSMDYEVLILSRISEAYAQTGEVKTAVVEGMARSGSVITGAALIFLSVFLPSAFSNSPAIKELGIGIVSAILLDATLVRLFLVPSFMMLMGKWNWWNPWGK
ncbi:MAG: MMPL family transporter [Candidatus Sericytochromatia bacterium]